MDSICCDINVIQDEMLVSVSSTGKFKFQKGTPIRLLQPKHYAAKKFITLLKNNKPFLLCIHFSHKFRMCDVPKDAVVLSYVNNHCFLKEHTARFLLLLKHISFDY